MKKINVEINGVGLVDQLLLLPHRYIYDNKEWNIHFNEKETPDEKQFFVVEGEMIYNHDLLLQSRFNGFNDNSIDPTRKIVYLDRYDKLLQSVHLTNILKSFNFEHFENLETYEIDLTQSKPVYHFDEQSCKYVIKPAKSARSMGIIFIDKHINLRDFLMQFRKIMKKEDATNQDFIKLFEAFELRYIVGSENEVDEMTKMFKRDQLLIQRMNPYNDAIEFRGLSGTDKPLFFRRDHLHMNQSNVFDTIFDENNVVEYLPIEIYEEIMELLSSGRLVTYGSHDIWYSPSANKWGIYEYQCQYGHVYLPSKRHSDFMKEVINQLYLKVNQGN